TVIVFGPAGRVGSVAALTAHEEGAQVVLAMRDPSKHIPILDNIAAERVQADLNQPKTIKAAVEQTGAKRAFIYLVHATRDGMRSSIEALKEAGVESVVFLSSFSVSEDFRTISPTEFVPYMHAQVEISLDEVFGDNGIVVRPGFFASNMISMKSEILSGEILGASVESFWFMDLTYLLSYQDAILIIARSIGKEVQVIKLEREEAVQDAMKKSGLPRPVAEWFVANITGPASDISTPPDYVNALKNVQAYTGQAPIKFEQWLEEKRNLFLE
ncbi:uncharacterized protein N7483_006536, partial [Penicillium malachiteum]|uniref:uncharacterized protein n=1 Tax=Penicillium malachiteum TaxID=1324776 RepID=UPI0025480158